MKPIEKPDGLLAKHNLLIRVIETDWATKLDHKVMAVLVERYMSAHRNSRASLRYLGKATRATRANVIASLRRLAGEHVIWVVREGVGTRPTEFGLNFNFPSGIACNTSGSGIVGNTTTETSGIVGDTARGAAGDTSKGASGIVGNTESLLHNPLTSGVTVKEKSAPALAPGLSAAPVGADFEVDKTIVELTVRTAEVDVDDEGTFVYVVMTDTDGGERDDSFTMESQSQRDQEAGQAQLAEFLRALGVEMPDDVSDLVGKKLLVIGRHGIPKYVPADAWGRRAMGVAA
ncbi:UNVERIFIED_ORG: hypothetical protein GGI57_004064 [Rhizobium aethiopicum]